MRILTVVNVREKTEESRARRSLSNFMASQLGRLHVRCALSYLLDTYTRKDSLTTAGMHLHVVRLINK